MTLEAARLNLAIESVLDAEGGYTPIDGGTKYGVTQAMWERYRAATDNGGITPADIGVINRIHATAFYRWYLTGCSRHHDILQIRPLTLMVMLAHCQVLMGHSAGTRVLQRAIGSIEADGMIGPQTLGALDRQTPQYVVINMEDEWRAKFDRIIEANPAKARFRDGWFARADGWARGSKP